MDQSEKKTGVSNELMRETTVAAAENEFDATELTWDESEFEEDEIYKAECEEQLEEADEAAKAAVNEAASTCVHFAEHATRQACPAQEAGEDRACFEQIGRFATANPRAKNPGRRRENLHRRRLRRLPLLAGRAARGAGCWLIRRGDRMPVCRAGAVPLGVLPERGNGRGISLAEMCALGSR